MAEPVNFKDQLNNNDMRKLVIELDPQKGPIISPESKISSSTELYGILKFLLKKLFNED